MRPDRRVVRSAVGGAIAVRTAWALLRWDVAMRRHQRATRRRLTLLLGPHVEPGATLAQAVGGVPASTRPEVLELLARVDLTAYRGAVTDRLYRALDELGSGR